MEPVSTEYIAQIDELDKWFQKNPKLPQQIDRLLLQRFFQCMYGNISKTKKIIEIHYEIRKKNPDLFIRQENFERSIQLTFEYADMLAMPGLTIEKYKIIFYRLRDFDPNKVHHADDIRSFFIYTDARFSLPDEPHTGAICSGELKIFDLNGYTMQHISKLKLAILRIYFKFLQDAFPVRLKGMHFINCPPFVDKLLKVMKPFLNRKVLDMVHLHTSNMDDLYRHIPRDMLPEEYGGKAGKLADLRAHTLSIIQEKRSYLVDPRYWVIE